jgi:hypothetical protein
MYHWDKINKRILNLNVTGVLELVRPAVGPVRYSIQMQMSVVGVFANRQQTTRHLAIIDISVSAYEF